MEIIRLNIIVPFFPSHSVKNMAEKMPMTDPRMIEPFKSVIY